MTSYTMRQAAKEMGLGPVQLSNQLLKDGILIQHGSQRVPKREFVQAGYFYTKTKGFERGPVSCQHLRIFVTQAGLDWLRGSCGISTHQ